MSRGRRKKSFSCRNGSAIGSVMILGSFFSCRRHDVPCVVLTFSGNGSDILPTDEDAKVSLFHITTTAFR